MMERADKFFRSVQLSRLLIGLNVVVASGPMLMGWADMSSLAIFLLVVLVVVALSAVAVSFKNSFWGLLVGNGCVAATGLRIITTQRPIGGIEIAQLAVVVTSLYFLTNGIFASVLANEQEQA